MARLNHVGTTASATNVCLFSQFPRPGVGDLVQRNIFLHLLRRTFSKAKVTWVVGASVTRLPFHHELVSRHSYADELLVCPDHDDDDDDWVAFMDDLSERRFEVCVVDPRSLRLGVTEAHQAGIPTRAALPTGRPDDELITHPILLRPRNPGRTDLFDYASALAAALGGTVAASPGDVVPRLPLRPESMPEWASHIIVVGIHPGCSRGWNRRWPLPSYVQLAARLADELGATILVLGSPDEREETTLLRNEVLARCPSAEVHLSIGEPLNRVANLIDRMTLLVGNDSGPAHLAASLFTPTVVIYGTDGEEAMWSDVYRFHLGVNKHYPCQNRTNQPNPFDGQCALGCPCDYVAPEGPYPRCLSDITVDEVWDAVNRQLSRLGLSPSQEDI